MSKKVYCLTILCLLISYLPADFRIAHSTDTFLMGISSKHISVAYLYLGKERGFFADEGIDLKLVFIPVSVAPSALIALQLDGMEFGSTAIQLRTRGAPLKTVFSQSQKPGWFLMSNPSVTELRQLSGKAISVGTFGSAAHNFTVEILKKSGMDPQSVVFIAGRGGSDIRLQMLINGTVQAANLLPPYTFIAERQGFRPLMFYGDHAELAQLGLVVHESFFKNKKALLKRVLRASLKSHLYTLDHQSEVVSWVSKNLKMEPRDAERTFDVLRKISTHDGRATESAILNAFDETGKMRGIKTNDLVDYSILSEIQEELGIK